MNLSRNFYRLVFSVLISLGVSDLVFAQKIDILLKGGHVIDPKNNIDAVMDVAISDGKILRLAPQIDAAGAIKVIDISGLYLSPGIIDIHVHVFAGTNKAQKYMDGPNSLPPDGFTLRSGVTTVVDAGSAGWKSFPLFKKNIIDNSKTRVLSFLNIVGDGMGEFEQDTMDMDPEMAASTAKFYDDHIVGFKVAHYNGVQWIPVDNAVAAGKLAQKPVMIDWRGLPPVNSFEELLLKHLRPGDILTHMYHAGKSVGAASPLYKESVLDENGKVKPYVFQAQNRGIIFDVGHGGNGFVFGQAIPSLKQGFRPNTISSDLHIGNMNAGMKDMANIMSKFLNMGMSVQDVIARSTWNPALSIQRKDLGHLSVGAEADIAVFNLKNGNFGFIDSHGGSFRGTKRLEAELTIRAGKVVWDLNGLATDAWDKAAKSK
ncbi:dihydroorotase [Daejeonella rubra]|uniref:Dihydroorotase n=1 Tax=Daejeonella rubra TaxID=990371 RepID=A0A1G9TIE4_9SPHI|nr:amidohydrolase/deacetylase family metallohydrolase [Daejeonella rubra]SDM47559.1 dihydroorotase [Daejeonella rubra]